VQSGNLKNEEAMAQVGQQHHKKKNIYSINNKDRISNCCMYFSLSGKQIISMISKFVWRL
jgi:hypothetical protein